MNEFDLINHFFKPLSGRRDDVVFGIGDDAACVVVPADQELLISTDTLVADVHFLSGGDAYDIAWKAIMVNVSDMAAMAANPCWVSLALTLPLYDHQWLSRFSQGLQAALQPFNLALIGGDTTRGPLSITITIHGLAPKKCAVRRQGAQPGDIIWLSGELGAAAQAVLQLNDETFAKADKATLMTKLQRPWPRVDLIPVLRQHATAAIDISDGLSADLQHICQASDVGAQLNAACIPIHPLVRKYQETNALILALEGGDDYELCFTTPATSHATVLEQLINLEKICYPIGLITQHPGLYLVDTQGHQTIMEARGYCHF